MQVSSGFWRRVLKLLNPKNEYNQQYSLRCTHIFHWHDLHSVNYFFHNIIKCFIFNNKTSSGLLIFIQVQLLEHEASFFLNENIYIVIFYTPKLLSSFVHLPFLCWPLNTSSGVVLNKMDFFSGSYSMWATRMFLNKLSDQFEPLVSW